MSIDFNSMLSQSTGYFSVALVAIKTSIEQMLPPNVLNHHLYRRLSPLILPGLGSIAGVAGFLQPQADIQSRTAAGAILGAVISHGHNMVSSVFQPPPPRPIDPTTVASTPNLPPPPPKVTVDNPD